MLSSSQKASQSPTQNPVPYRSTVQIPAKRHSHLVRSGYRASGNSLICFSRILIRCLETKELLVSLVVVLLKLVACCFLEVLHSLSASQHPNVFRHSTNILNIAFRDHQIEGFFHNNMYTCSCTAVLF